MRKWLSAADLACVCAACGGREALVPDRGPRRRSPTDPRKKKAPPEPVYKEVTLPAGTTLRLDLKSSVASDTSKVEDTVRAALRQAVVVDGQTVLPVGTELVGTVTDVARSGRVKGRARRLSLQQPASRLGALRHQDRDDLSRGRSRPRRRTPPRSRSAPVQARRSARFSAAASGAAKGAAIGGGAGTGAVLATRGDEVRRGPGADVTTRLTAPLTVRVKA